MMYLWEVKKSNVKKISKTLLLDSGTLTPLLKKLESKGYITRSRSVMDERNLDVEITVRGMSVRDKALNIPMEVGKCIDLSEEDAKTLYSLIYKVLINTQKEEDNGK